MEIKLVIELSEEVKSFLTALTGQKQTVEACQSPTPRPEKEMVPIAKDTSALTLADTQKLLTKYASQGVDVKGLLTELGVQRISDLDTAYYNKLVEMAKARLEA